MSVLIEHIPTLSCEEKHNYVRDGHYFVTDRDEEGNALHQRVTGWASRCLDCGAVLEFRMDQDYPT